MSEQLSYPPLSSLLTPVQKHKYTALLTEARDLRAALKEARERIAELEHELNSLRPSVKSEAVLENQLVAFLGPHYDNFTKTERHCLRLFLKKAPNLVRHAEIMDWLYAGVVDVPYDKIRDVYVSKLRGKFRKYNIQATLVTIWGEGWKLVHGPEVEPGAKTFMLKSHREGFRAAHSIADIEGQSFVTDFAQRGRKHSALRRKSARNE